MRLELQYPDLTGPGVCTYTADNAAMGSPPGLPLLSFQITLAPGENSQDRVLEAAAQIVLAAERHSVALEVGEVGNYPPTPTIVPVHLRIYSVPGFPQSVANRHRPDEPPLEYDWGLLGLQKIKLLAPGDKGDVPEMRYQLDGEDVARRLFTFDYATDSNGATELTVTETPAWARNDGTWCEGPSKTQVYNGQRYNEWRDSARQRIFGGLKTWLPRVLVALGVVADVPAGEALSGGWLASKHAAQWNYYMTTGRKDGPNGIAASLTADTTTEWMSAEVPEDLIPGVAAGTTVREMILGALR